MASSRRHVPVDTGGRVGDYVLGRRLGAGGMGAVYETVRGGSRVAIKLPYTETLSDDYAARRFRDEGIAGSIVEHPNLVHVFERGETPTGIPFLVMEEIVGERLALQMIAEGFSLRRSATLVRQLLAGLDALHSAGIVHADVKTDNILLARIDGREVAKLIDFGLAHADLESRPYQRKADLISGTPDYMAPEVIRGEGSSPASDIYAAGVILYELITGTTPFGGGTSDEIIQRHLTEDVIPPSLRRPDREVPLILERIVMRALEKEPSKRYPSAAAFAAALAVAMPVLDDEVVERQPRTAFSTESKTLDWISRSGRLRRRSKHSEEDAEQRKQNGGRRRVIGGSAHAAGKGVERRKRCDRL